MTDPVAEGVDELTGGSDDERASPTADIDLLTTGTLEPLGQIREASNATLLCDVSIPASGEEGDRTARCVYKPVRGEQPLWDFPDGTLAGREVASYLISRAMGLHLIPPTVLRDGPYGVGMVQAWVEPDAAGDDADDDRLEPVDLCAPEKIPDGWLPVLTARGPDGSPLVLVHADTPQLRRLAVLDLVINNADRKGGHILAGAGGALFGVDHGICLHGEDKLRTVLWGWAGQSLNDDDLGAVRAVADALTDQLPEQLAELITQHEIAAVSRRVRNLLQHPEFPVPDRPRPIPWPPF